MIPESTRAWKNRLFSLPSGRCPLGELTLAGAVRNSRGAGALRPRIFGQWAFVYLVAGSGVYEDALGTRREVQAGDWILVFPELAHHYGPRPGNFWNEIYVCFQGPIFEQWRASGLLDASRPTGTLCPVSFWWKELASVLKHIGQKGTSTLEAVTSWQHWLGRVITNQIPAKTESQRWQEQACRLLSENLSVEDSNGRTVAKTLGMGYESFRKKFVRHMGVPPGRFRERQRIEKARQLLQSKRLTNKELADTLGFYDEAHFSKSFRRHVGLSPRAFSRSLFPESPPHEKMRPTTSNRKVHP